MRNVEHLEQLTKLIRKWILEMTTAAGSGHLTSSLSAVELMVGLLFGGEFRYRVDEPEYHNNDRLIFSKGHASPLLYSLWAAAGKITEEELLTLRKFGSRLEGHPTRTFPYCEVATGSLGQGLSVGVGMALNAKLDKLSYKTYVLLGDSEMAEGSNWEAMQLASHYKLDNLVGIIDVNRLGQRGETMYGWNLENYQKKCEAFGWKTVICDGHDIAKILEVYSGIIDGPTMIIAKTVKGKGVNLLEDKDGWHGRTLNQEQLAQALVELGEVDKYTRGTITEPEVVPLPAIVRQPMVEIDTEYEKSLATRKAYGHALVEAYPHFPEMVVLDAEVSNSTYSELFKQKYPERFLEMFIAEQNMVGTAVGLALRGKIVFASTFASFFTRAVDQIRVASYSQAHVNFVGSHVGVSIGEDGPTQMGLEDIAIFRAIHGSTVLYPADHVSEEKLVKAMIEHPGIGYMRTTRMDTLPLYNPDEEFVIGGSKTLRSSDKDQVTVVAAGVTLYEALKAEEDLRKRGIGVRVIDLYSIKPLDQEILKKAARETKALVVVEDHLAEGGVGEAVMRALSEEKTPIYSLAVGKMPKSGKPEELLHFMGIDKQAIIGKINSLGL